MIEWRTVTLGSISSSVSYGYTASANSDCVGPKFLRITDIVPHQINWDTVPYCEIGSKDLQKYQLNVGDIVIARTGATTGYNAMFKGGINAVFASYLIRFKIDPKEADSKYVSYVLQSPHYYGFIAGSIGGSAQPGINAAILSQFSFSLPPLPVQKKIAAILSSLDDKIEQNTRMNKVLEEIARVLFHRWFVEFEFPNAEGKPYKSAGGKMVESEMGMVPEGWGIGTTKDLGVLNPNSWSNKNKPDLVNYIDLSNVKCGEISDVITYPYSEAPSRARRILEIGDTIIGTVRPGNRSFTYIQEEGLTGSTGFAVIRPFNQNTREFLYLHLTQDDVIDNLAHIADGGAYPAVSPNVIMDYNVVLPPAEILLAFSRTVSQLFRKISVNQSQNRVLKNIQDGLLPKLMNDENEV